MHVIGARRKRGPELALESRADLLRVRLDAIGRVQIHLAGVLDDRPGRKQRVEQAPVHDRTIHEQRIDRKAPRARTRIDVVGREAGQDRIRVHAAAHVAVQQSEVRLVVEQAPTGAYQ